MSQDKLATAARAAGFAMAADDELLSPRKVVSSPIPKAVIKAALLGQSQAPASTPTLWQRTFPIGLLPSWTAKA